MALVGAAEWGLAARRGSRRGSAGGRVRHRQGSRLGKRAGSRGRAEDVGGQLVAEDGQRTWVARDAWVEDVRWLRMGKG